MTLLDQRQRILDQYSSAAGRSLYRHVMGDGGDHIHYGLYRDAGTSMREALEASCRRLFEMALSRLGRGSLRDILDLGAGAGGPAKYLLAWTGARITCVDLGAPPLRDLENWASAAGLASRLRTWNGSFGALPEAWNSGFDLVWSQDALCHADERAAVFSEARKALRPGGAFVFSDILLAEDAPGEQARAFTAVNAVQKLGTGRAYARDLRQAGFADIHCEDWTPHLAANFRRMRNQIEARRSLMLEEGVGEDLLDGFAQALEARLRWPSGSVLEWRAYLCMPG
jgi:sarcosine/dimethylglycine N-methyltransferase